jgi:hypothetical protein
MLYCMLYVLYALKQTQYAPWLQYCTHVELFSLVHLVVEGFMFMFTTQLGFTVVIVVKFQLQTQLQIQLQIQLQLQIQIQLQPWIWLRLKLQWPNGTQSPLLYTCITSDIICSDYCMYLLTPLYLSLMPRVSHLLPSWLLPPFPGSLVTCIPSLQFQCRFVSKIDYMWVYFKLKIYKWETHMYCM